MTTIVLKSAMNLLPQGFLHPYWCYRSRPKRTKSKGARFKFLDKRYLLFFTWTGNVQLPLSTQYDEKDRIMYSENQTRAGFVAALEIWNGTEYDFMKAMGQGGTGQDGISC